MNNVPKLKELRIDTFLSSVSEITLLLSVNIFYLRNVFQNDVMIQTSEYSKINVIG